MPSKILTLLFIFLNLITFSQNAKLILTGNTLRMVSSGATSHITLQNADWINNASYASFVPGQGTVLFVGTSNPAIIGGTDSTQFYNFHSDKSSSESQLDNTIYVSNEVRLINGNVYLSDHKLDLGATGSLVGETYPSGLRAYCNDNESGIISAVRTLSIGFNSNIAGLGLDLTMNGGSPGSTVFMRGHDRQTSTSPNGSTGIGRFYDIVPAFNSGFTFNFLFKYHEAELYSMLEEDFVFYRNPTYGALTNAWEEWGAGNGISSPGYPDLIGLAAHNPAVNEVFLQGINSFSRWTVSNYFLNPLPVELMSFRGECIDEQVELTWITTSEINNDFFTVDYSKDLINWESLGTVNGSGNSNEQHVYSLIDYRPSFDNTYYRLTQVDFDGDAKVFDYISVKCNNSPSKSDEMMVYPNPAENKFTLSIQLNNEAKKSRLSIVDINGKLMFEQTLNLNSGKNELNFDNLNLASGTYIIFLNGENYLIPPIKLIIK